MQLQNFIQVPDRPAVFAYVPKVACTNWKAVLRQMAGAADYLDAGRAHDRTRSGLVHLDQLPAPEAQRLLTSPEIARFTFVRNPYTRVLSAYLNKFRRYAEFDEPARPGDYFHEVFVEIDRWRAAKLPDEGRVTFKVFLQWLQGSDHPMTQNEHWIAQTEIIGLESVHYDWVGRFENIRADAAELLRRFGCGIEFPSQAAIRFPSSGTAELRDLYLDGDARLRIENLFRRDFDRLGYDLGVLS